MQGGWDDEGNIDADPLFVDPHNEDFHLSPGSPCVDAADNTDVPPDEYDIDNDQDTSELLPLDVNGDPRFVDDLCTADTGQTHPGFPELPIVDMGPMSSVTPARNPAPATSTVTAWWATPTWASCWKIGAKAADKPRAGDCDGRSPMASALRVGSRVRHSLCIPASASSHVGRTIECASRNRYTE